MRIQFVKLSHKARALHLLLALVLGLLLVCSALSGILITAGPFFQDAGKAIVTNLVSGLGGTVPKYCGMGTGAGPADATATALTTEVESRATGTPTRVTTTVTNDTYQVVGTQTATATRAITEVGLFDAAAAGNALILSSITVINLANGDSLQVTYKLKFA